jgi:hypothetical protein
MGWRGLEVWVSGAALAATGKRQIAKTATQCLIDMIRSPRIQPHFSALYRRAAKYTQNASLFDFLRAFSFKSSL